jgi:hypothetical protein
MTNLFQFNSTRLIRVFDSIASKLMYLRTINDKLYYNSLHFLLRTDNFYVETTNSLSDIEGSHTWWCSQRNDIEKFESLG